MGLPAGSEVKANAQANPPISTSGCCHNGCSAQGAKIGVSIHSGCCKTYCEDNPFQRIVRLIRLLIFEGRKMVTKV